MKYQRKEFLAVEAERYDGSFELAFLRPNERLRAGAPGGASILIDRDANPGWTVSVAKGQWAVRLRDGSVHAMDDELFREEYEPASTAGQQEGGSHVR